jgi:preprotein translocase subunit SecA
VGGLVLNEGKIAEMKTGEGKTLVALLPSFLNSLYGNGVHVITINDYLAKRDSQIAGQVLHFLGLTVGLIQEEMLFFERQDNYNCDITYLTHAEVGFDYLRDNMVYIPEKIVQKPLFYCIIDEVDSILIDESKTPLIISGSGKISGLSYRKTAILVKRLKLNVHYLVEEKTQSVRLTTMGYSFCENALQVIDLYDIKTPWISYILNSIKAQVFFELNKNYIISNDNEVIIVDGFTGRAMPGRRWSAGLHQAVEAKEYLPIQREVKTLASISYQNLFLLYKGLSGMTGTAKTEESELKKIYRLKVVPIPTNSKNKRKDLEDVVYFKESTKWRCIARECCNFYTLGRPILIGTTTIANSEVMSSVLLAYNIPHKVLNARPENVLNETHIIAQAGCKSSITIATNMAGRGTDILLGGNPQFLATFFIKNFFKNDVENPIVQTFIRFIYVQFKKTERIEIKRVIDLITFCTFKSSKFKEELLYEVKNTDDRNFNPYQELYNSVFKAQKLLVTTNYNSVLYLGGLYVIGTELHDSRRIDNQLRGRAGRQGDPGSSQFFLSLEENLLLKEFGGTNVLEQMKKYKRSDLETPLKSTKLTKTLKIAQKKNRKFLFG